MVSTPDSKTLRQSRPYPRCRDKGNDTISRNCCTRPNLLARL